MTPRVLTPKQKIPDTSEAAAVGAFKGAILRGSVEFKQLVKNENPDVVFKIRRTNKDDPRTMTRRLSEKVDALAELVKAEFPGLKLRITAAWDENPKRGKPIHAPTSRHLEGRAVDITTSDRDGKKLGRLGSLAVEAGFDWVFFENSLHVHASVKR
jgi:hypothetical protein